MTYSYRHILVVLLLLSIASAESDVLEVPGPRSTYDISHDYHMKLLGLALEAGAQGRTVPELKTGTDMVEGRALRELSKDQWLDLYWLGTDNEKEQLLRAIPIPTTRGLIGFRRLLIHRDNESLFDQVTRLQDLKRLFACQGTDWPDTKILRRAGFRVTTTPVYESLFDMLEAGRCDYFPRGYHDQSKELVIRAGHYPELRRYDDLMLHYPFAVYFFTSKANEELAQWIETGLERLIDNGRFMQFMREHPLTEHIFPLPDSPAVRYFSIDNPLLPPATDYNDSRYWFTPEDFGV